MIAVLTVAMAAACHIGTMLDIKLLLLHDLRRGMGRKDHIGLLFWQRLFPSTHLYRPQVPDEAPKLGGTRGLM